MAAKGIKNTISVITSVEDVPLAEPKQSRLLDDDSLMRTTGLGSYVAAAFGRKTQIDPDDLAKRLTGLLNSMGGVLKSLPPSLGDFKLDTMTLDVEISAEGEVSLLGTGVKVGGKGGLSFTLKRDT